MSGLLGTLPVHLVCQLITRGNDSFENFTLSADTSSPQQNMTLPNGYTAFPDVGVAMKYYANDLTWNLARKHCVEEGGNLAVIDSIEKSIYGNNLRKSNPRGPFLGIHKLYDNVEWVSVKTGSPLRFIPWKSGLNRSSEAPSCTALYGDYGGRVGPFDCNRAWSYLCEIPILQKYKSDLLSSPILDPNKTVQHIDSVDIAVN